MPISLLSRTPPPADHRVKYGAADLQFGDLRLPEMKQGARAPMLVFLHGGWWQNEYDLEYGGHLCAALKAVGIATWSLEYRRVGDSGGGFPGTLEDAAAGYDYLTTLAKTYPLDLNHVAVAGHSAGGHLAFWLAGRHHLPDTGELRRPSGILLPMKSLVGLAGAVDLRMTIDLSGFFTFAHDKDQVYSLMGGTPGRFPERYAVANPGDLLPLNVPQTLLQGSEDTVIPPQLPGQWAERARRVGDTVAVQMIQGADHFDVVDPQSAAWPRVMASLMKSVLG